MSLGRIEKNKIGIQKIENSKVGYVCKKCKELIKVGSSRFNIDESPSYVGELPIYTLCTKYYDEFNRMINKQP